MPHTVPVSKLMIHRNHWPQLRAETTVKNALNILRILSEDTKLSHGYSTPLVLDDEYNLIGLVRLTDLLRAVRHLCEFIPDGQACDLGPAIRPVSDLVVKFPGVVTPDDSILKALDLMLDHGVSLVPVMRDHKFLGMIKLADIFNTVASLLFDEEIEDEKTWLEKHLHL